MININYDKYELGMTKQHNHKSQEVKTIKANFLLEYLGHFSNRCRSLYTPAHT